MVLEEQPEKVSEAFRLFLQGQGYCLKIRKLTSTGIVYWMIKLHFNKYYFRTKYLNYLLPLNLIHNACAYYSQKM